MASYVGNAEEHWIMVQATGRNADCSLLIKLCPPPAPLVWLQRRFLYHNVCHTVHRWLWSVRSLYLLVKIVSKFSS
jgi:hypothetical protein